MDNATLVDQIVQSLSFEVIAVPQAPVVQVESTSKSTPLNVKIRVRKKDDAVLRHGVLSMPKVERKDNQPHRIRLVSSDQTIMSFNVVMETDFDKIPPKHRIEKLNTVAPDREEYPSLSKKADNYNDTSILYKRNKDIFGRCKPGGCLDPPFGEEKYSYQPAPQGLSLPTKDDTTKLRTSSIFKNKFFKRVKKSSHDEKFFRNDTKAETGPVLSLYESGSLQTGATHSNSLITYPNSNVSNSSKLRLEGEKVFKNKKSSEDYSRFQNSVSEGSGSLYMVSKKVRNQAEDKTKYSDVSIKRETFELDKPEFKNILRTTTEPDSGSEKSYKPTQTEKEELKYTSKIPTFIPVPIPLNFAIKGDKKDSTEIQVQSEIKTASQTEILALKDDMNDENKDADAKFNNDVNSGESLTQKSNSALGKIAPLNGIDDITDSSNKDIKETSNKFNEKNLSDIQIINEATPQDIVQTIENQSSMQTNADSAFIREQHVEDQSDNHIITANKPSFIETMNGNVSNNDLDTNSIDKQHHMSDDIEKTNIKSIPLIPTRNESLLDVTTDGVHQELNNEEEDYSTVDLKHIWKNKTQPLNSAADVITENTLPTKKVSDANLDVSQESKDSEFKTIYDSEATQEDTKDEMQSSENEMKELKTKKLDQTFPVTKLDTESINRFNIDDDEKKTETGPKTENKENLDDKHIPDYDTLQNMSVDMDKIKEKPITADQSSFVERKELFDKSKKLDELSSEIKHPQTTTVTSDDSENMSNFENSIKQQVKISLHSPEDNLITDSQEARDKIDIDEKTKIFPDRVESFEKKQSQDSNKIHTIIAKELQQTPQSKQTPHLLADTVSAIAAQFKDDFKGPLHKPALPTILRKDKIPWNIDIALQSYTDENNKRVIKSYDSANVPERHPYDALLVAQCSMENEFNEIKIPIDLDNDLCVQIKNNHSRNRPVIGLTEKSMKADESPRKKKITMNLQDGTDHVGENIKADYQDANMSEANKYNKTISDDTRDVLTIIYEQELVPLQNIIKGLREEIDTLLVNQMKFKETVHKLAPKRSRPIRLNEKKCSCVKKL